MHGVWIYGIVLFNKGSRSTEVSFLGKLHLAVETASKGVQESGLLEISEARLEMMHMDK